MELLLAIGAVSAMFSCIMSVYHHSWESRRQSDVQQRLELVQTDIKRDLLIAQAETRGALAAMAAMLNNQVSDHNTRLRAGGL